MEMLHFYALFPTSSGTSVLESRLCVCFEVALYRFSVTMETSLFTSTTIFFIRY